MDRLDRTMKAILRAGAYELIARGAVPVGAVVSEYVDVAKAFFAGREAGFANGLLDAIGKDVRGPSASNIRSAREKSRCSSALNSSEENSTGLQSLMPLSDRVI